MGRFLVSFSVILSRKLTQMSQNGK